MQKYKNGPIYEKLKSYGESDYYGFHMPGHKRQMGAFTNPYQIDITEIPDFDDLHHPEEQGILSQAQERAARLYGAEETHFLVNGSTAGILSAISGCTTMNGKLLMARNCHRSVYHAVALRNLEAVYIYPQQLEGLGINGAISPEDVEKILAQEKDVENVRKIQAVFITSPTYDGICSDVRSIAEICHEKGIPLIVDQAHGAHFPFSEYFPEDAISAGADVVIHSVHKTLPSMTQTALLHVQGELVNREKLRYYLSVYQSSSPSYLLMASIDSCMELLEREGKSLFQNYVEKLKAFRESCRDLECLRLAEREDIDPSKLLIITAGSGLSGEELAELLRERYHLQMEMTTPTYLVGISSVADTEEGFRRFSQALHELDAELAEDLIEGSEGQRKDGQARTASGVRFPSGRLQKPAEPQAMWKQGEALELEKESVRVAEAQGRISAVYVYLYPPGIPILVPGEAISQEVQEQIAAWKTAGLEVHGLTEEETIYVLK